ncbi:hypothetical protein NIE88_09580 [Sporolactobacillus shoreicorticis]|uniref:Uncharacterized protein n=1 Tax=Sporolactobacillus shoreicorticis TaxID=1923877 RepID=A0ABW5SBE9_9BACL|nr:hypothetical protein [Sporolactobacillus shoreicorticis]MCO7126025.1 hypothetical protein [Sporolactobacillus shoreicorticis]
MVRWKKFVWWILHGFFEAGTFGMEACNLRVIWKYEICKKKKLVWNICACS